MKKRTKQTLEEKLLNLEQELKVSVAPYYDQNLPLLMTSRCLARQKWQGNF